MLQKQLCSPCSITLLFPLRSHGFQSVQIVCSLWRISNLKSFFEPPNIPSSNSATRSTQSEKHRKKDHARSSSQSSVLRHQKSFTTSVSNLLHPSCLARQQPPTMALLKFNVVLTPPPRIALQAQARARHVQADPMKRLALRPRRFPCRGSVRSGVLAGEPAE